MSFKGGSSLTYGPVFFLRTAILSVVCALGVFLQVPAYVILGVEYGWSSIRFDSGEIEVPHTN